MNKLTGNEGASLERQAWMAKVVRMGKARLSMAQAALLDELMKFGEGRTKRNADKPGSLGRKKAK